MYVDLHTSSMARFAAMNLHPFFFFSHFARALLASNGGGPVKLRVLPEGGMEVDDLPGASLLEVPPTGGIDAKECLMVNQLDGSFCEVSCTRR